MFLVRREREHIVNIPDPRFFNYDGGHFCIAFVSFSTKDFVDVIFTAGIGMHGCQHVFVSVKETDGGSVVNDIIGGDNKIGQLFFFPFVHTFEKSLQLIIGQGVITSKHLLDFPNGASQTPRGMPDDERVGEGVFTDRVCQIVPPVIFRPGTQSSLYGIVSQIDKVGPGFFVSPLRSTPERTLKESTAPAADQIMFSGKACRVFLYKCGQCPPAASNNTQMNMVGHLTEGKNPDPPPERPDDATKLRKKYQIVADAIENKITVNGSLITMIQDPSKNFSLPFHSQFVK